MKGFLLGEGCSATGHLVKGMQTGFFSTKEKLGWSGTIVNLKMQAECLQIETNKPCGRDVLLMVQKSVGLFHVLYEEQNSNILNWQWLCLFWREEGGKGGICHPYMNSVCSNCFSRSLS